MEPRVGAAVWVKNGDAWKKGTVTSLTQNKNKKGSCVVCIGKNQFITVKPTAKTFVSQKHQGRKIKNTPLVLEAKTVTNMRPVSLLKVQPSWFRGTNQPGDFLHMIRFMLAWFFFNENYMQWKDIYDTRPGGGNAAIRPYRHNNAIGLPTGHNGVGFTSLQQVIHTAEYGSETVIDILNEAFRRAVDRIVYRNSGLQQDYANRTTLNAKDHMNAFPMLDTIYYSAGNEAHELTAPYPPLGVAIFRPSAEVIAYITKQLYALPARVQIRMMEIRRLFRQGRMEYKYDALKERWVIAGDVVWKFDRNGERLTIHK